MSNGTSREEDNLLQLGNNLKGKSRLISMIFNHF